ncbi:cation acetate symporter, partial [Pseudoalteromonas carrageenovora]
FTVPRVKYTRISAAWTLVFIDIVYTTAPAVASFARVNMIATNNGKDGSATEYAEAPAWIKNWERTRLIT